MYERENKDERAELVFCSRFVDLEEIALTYTRGKFEIKIKNKTLSMP